jgi:hypothetical protein
MRVLIAVTLAVSFVFGSVSCRGSGQPPPTPQYETSYAATLAAINATQVARNAAVYRGTVADPSTETITRFSRELVVALEAYRLDLERLDPPADVEGRHRAMVRATENLISSSRALRDGLGATEDLVSKIHLLEAQSSATLAFDSACRDLNPPGFLCGALIERWSTPIGE